MVAVATATSTYSTASMYPLATADFVAILNGAFAAVDVEISSRSPLAICSMGAARFESGVETGFYNTPIRTTGRIRFGQIHGLTHADLIAAPAWPTVWHDFLQFVEKTRVFVAFNASFDRGAILAMCGRHGVRPPPMRFICAAALSEACLGRRLDLPSAVAALGLAFPGRHHDALADARAAGAVAVKCAELRAGRSGEA